MLTMIWGWITNWVVGWGGLGALVAIGAWALWFFCPAFLKDYKSQLLHIAVAATVFVVSATYFFTFGFNKGYSVAIHAVAAQDERAINEKDQALKTVRECRASGRHWDVPSGMCQ